MAGQYKVHDRSATLNEWNVAWALDRLQIIYYFQYAPFGNRGLRGEYVVDFLLSEIPGQGIIEVQGEYWHSGQLGSDDMMRKAAIEAATSIEVKFIWGVECETKDDALAWVRKEYGGAL